MSVESATIGLYQLEQLADMVFDRQEFFPFFVVHRHVLHDLFNDGAEHGDQKTNFLTV